MISKSVCTSSKDAVKYFEDHLSVADYFSKGEKLGCGQFIGKVAERLGLKGKSVTREKFIAFTQCDMKALGAKTNRQRKSDIKYIEFTYSAPKAVSIAAALDDRVKRELLAAVKEELRWFEKHVMVRDRRGSLANEEVTKPTREMIAAIFAHDTSRSNDPDFHVHSLIGNVTWDEERKGYFAVHYGEMLELRKTLDARIHNSLAARMAQLGYHIEAAPAGFGLKEVPAAALDLFSERSHQVKTVKTLLLAAGYSPGQVAKALGGKTDEQKRQLLARPELFKELLGKPQGKPIFKADFATDHIAVTLSRPKKVLITSETLRTDVARRLEEAGLSVGKPSWLPVKNNLDLKAVFQLGTQAVFEKTSVVRLDVLHGEIVRLAPGRIDNDLMETVLRDDRRFLIRRKDNLELVTTRNILNEERTLLSAVIRGMGKHKPLQKKYVPPDGLVATPARIEQLVSQANLRGEELNPEQMKKWLNDFAAIHRYCATATDGHLNVRGGAGTGKTFCLQTLIELSLEKNRPVFICAPYGEQARVTLRKEAPRIEASGQLEVARAFAHADTVDALLLRARREPTLLHGADIYVDEAGLLDTPKALSLVQEAERAGARIIFQGDTEQMTAVGRGQPLKLLETELGLGMNVPRASISRRQLTNADKEIAADLSSGNDERFARAVKAMLDRDMIRETPPAEAVEIVAQEIVAARSEGRDIVAVASVHRICDAVAARVHELHSGWTGQKGVLLDVHIKRELQSTELLSSQFHKIGSVAEYKKGNMVMRATVVAVSPDALKVQHNGVTSEIPLRQVRAVFDLSRIERGPGEMLLLQEKIKQQGRIFEKGSRQTISHIEDQTVHFKSGLKLQSDDGRIRQGDCLTDYRVQGTKGAEVRGIEDNGSALAMANRQAFHIKGTRHEQNLILHVESKELYIESIQRTNAKFAALDLERLPMPERDRGKLFMKVRAWGKDFLARKGVRKQCEQAPQMNSRFDHFRRSMRKSSRLTHDRPTAPRQDHEKAERELTPSQQVRERKPMPESPWMGTGLSR